QEERPRAYSMYSSAASPLFSCALIDASSPSKTYPRVCLVTFPSFMLAPLLCEFARKKENPSLERYIAPPSGLFVVYGPQHSDAPPTIASFSAAPPVMRGHGRSHASRCLFVRDQEPSCASHFRPCWRCCRHKEGNEVAVVTLCIPAGACLAPCRALPP